jgi:hypothetical protein
MNALLFLKVVGGHALRFALRHWVWLALIAAVLAANHYRDQSGERLAERDAALVRAEQAEVNANAWKAAHDRQVALAIETAKARAEEAATLARIDQAAGTAREEIENAPGADDPYRFSDGAAGFMRDRPGANRNASGSAPNVDRR